MKKYKITHNRPECIGCGSCAAVAPDYWEMDEEGLSHLKGSTPDGEKEVKEITEEELAENKEAEDVCPVDIIKIEEIR